MIGTCLLADRHLFYDESWQSIVERVLRPRCLIVHGDEDDHILYESNALAFHREMGEKSELIALKGVRCECVARSASV